MKLDKQGIEQLKKEILLVEERLSKAKMEKGEVFLSDTNSWHDNAAYDAAKLKVDGLVYQLSTLREELGQVTLVAPHKDATRVDLGDFVSLYNKGADDRFKVLLTADYINEVDDAEDEEIIKISINSPIGESIFGKKKGDKASYKVNNKTCEVEILDFEKSKTNVKPSTDRIK